MKSTEQAAFAAGIETARQAALIASVSIEIRPVHMAWCGAVAATDGQMVEMEAEARA